MAAHDKTRLIGRLLLSSCLRSCGSPHRIQHFDRLVGAGSVTQAGPPVGAIKASSWFSFSAASMPCSPVSDFERFNASR